MSTTPKEDDLAGAEDIEDEENPKLVANAFEQKNLNRLSNAKQNEDLPLNYEKDTRLKSSLMKKKLGLSLGIEDSPAKLCNGIQTTPNRAMMGNYFSECK